MAAMQATETEIRQAVMEHLAADARVSIENVEVLVSDGQVILRGSVPSYRSKWAAAEAAGRVRGVFGVDNEIEVRVPAPTGDDHIANDIRSSLMRDVDLDSAGINVQVHQGRVRLMGTVPTSWARLRAEEDARWTRGVVAVTNELAVVPSASPADSELAVQIQQALRRDAAVQAENIEVTVSNRHATLSGVVASWAERNAALDDALHVPGVTHVSDALSIRYR